MSSITSQKVSSPSIDYLKVGKIVASRWYWIGLSVLFSLSVTYVYLWYTPKIYSNSASLKFSEEKTEITELLAVKNLYDRTNRVQAETYVIQSKDVLLNAISRLDYKVSYFVKGRVRTSDLYPEKPFPIEILKIDTSNFFNDLINIKPINKKQFILTLRNTSNTYTYGTQINLRGLSFIIRNGPDTPESEYLIKFNTQNDFLRRVSSGLTMREATKSSNVLLLNFTDQNRYFAKDILNAIIKEYIYFDGYRRSISASQTIEFINEQLAFLADQVNSSGTALARFKQQNKVFDLESIVNQNTGKAVSQDEQKRVLKLEEIAINQLEEKLNQSQNNTDFNYQIEGRVDAMLSGLVSQLNNFILEKSKLLVTYTPNSDVVKTIDKQIADTKKAIRDNINSFRERNSRVQRYVDQQISSSEQKLIYLPNTERTFIKLQSDFEINQKVFSYLFEKKLEAQISKAAVVPGASVVDFAAGEGSLISPVASRAYTYAIIWGIAAAVGLIILVRLVNPFIYHQETVQHLTDTPILGIIRKFPGFVDKDNTQVLSLEKPKSIFAESVRSVRTNLSFLASEKKSKIICVTSEIAGEGKSFVSINLASTLALIEKRVVLVGGDLRKSKLHRTFHTDNKTGLSTYLSQQHSLDNITLSTDNPNLDFIPSGPVPPNPSELLHTQRMNDLLITLSEKYDFVLIDTAPVGLVSDSIPLIRQADINLFVLRSGVSRYNAANIPGRIAGEYNLNNVVIVLNAFTEDVFHSRYYSSGQSSVGAYQYYYSDYSGYAGDGYFEDEEKMKWWNWKRWFKR